MAAPDARGSRGARWRRLLLGAALVALLPSPGATAEPEAAPTDVDASAPREAAIDPEAPVVVISAPAADDGLDALSAELDAAGAANPDPFEGVNRSIFSFNNGVDFVLLDPLTRAYRFVLGDFARQSVRNFFANLKTPVVLVNNLLQLQGRDAAITTARFVVNSTMGMGGLFDPAASFGLEPRVAGFGETLGAAGFSSGPYLILPLLGPTTVRDGFGNLVDAAMAPQTYILPIVGTVLITGSNGVVERAEHYEGLRALRESSIDYYASLRSAYFDSRR